MRNVVNSDVNLFFFVGMFVKVIVVFVWVVGYMLYVRNFVKEFLCVGIFVIVNIFV